MMQPSDLTPEYVGKVAGLWYKKQLNANVTEVDFMSNLDEGNAEYFNMGHGLKRQVEVTETLIITATHMEVQDAEHQSTR